MNEGLIGREQSRRRHPVEALWIQREFVSGQTIVLVWGQLECLMFKLRLGTQQQPLLIRPKVLARQLCLKFLRVSCRKLANQSVPSAIWRRRHCRQEADVALANG